jgi:hypothetical protein
MRQAARRRRGWLTYGESAAANRHGRSAAFVIPIRVPVRTFGAVRSTGRGSNVIGPSPSRLVPLRSSPMLSAWVSLPGPEHRSSSRSPPRR